MAKRDNLVACVNVGLGTAFLLGGCPYKFGIASRPFMLLIEPDESVWWLAITAEAKARVG